MFAEVLASILTSIHITFKWTFSHTLILHLRNGSILFFYKSVILFNRISHCSKSFLNISLYYLITKLNKWCFARFGTICTIQKCGKDPWTSDTFSKVAGWKFTKSITLPWVFFMFLRLYKWYQITQSVSNTSLE